MTRPHTSGAPARPGARNHARVRARARRREAGCLRRRRQCGGRARRVPRHCTVCAAATPRLRERARAQRRKRGFRVRVLYAARCSRVCHGGA
eukprot:355379-Chlamydomonas_euryale.AAC.1